MSCIQTLARLSRIHHIAVDYDGKIFRILPLDGIILIYRLIVMGILFYIMRHFTYYPVTIIGNFVYSRVIASTLSLCNIPYVISKGNNKISYYETLDKEEVAFEGPTYNMFMNSTCGITEVPIIAHSSVELDHLQQHTGLQKLFSVQESILSKMDKINNIPMFNFESLNCNNMKSPVIHIQKIFGNMYYVRTINESWLTRLIISDVVTGLNINDELISSCAKIRETNNSNP